MTTTYNFSENITRQKTNYRASICNYILQMLARVWYTKYKVGRRLGETQKVRHILACVLSLYSYRVCGILRADDS